MNEADWLKLAQGQFDPPGLVRRVLSHAALVERQLSPRGQHNDRAATLTLPSAESEHGRLLDEIALTPRVLAPETGVERSSLVLLADRDRVLDEQRDAAHRVGFELFEPV